MPEIGSAVLFFGVGRPPLLLAFLEVEWTIELSRVC